MLKPQKTGGSVCNLPRFLQSDRGALFSWVTFMLGMALVAATVGWTWHLVGPTTYQGGDGKGLQATIHALHAFAPHFEINVLNPLQGAYAFNTPINVWGNPIYWPFLFYDRSIASAISTFICYSAMSTAIFALTRRFGLPTGTSIAGSLAAIAVIPPFFVSTGFGWLLVIIPDAAFSSALLIFAATLLYRVRPTWRALSITTLLLSALLSYAVYADPGWFVGAGFILAPLIAFCVFDGWHYRVILARICVLITTFAILYSLGFVTYVHALFSYSSRAYFAKAWPRPQEFIYTSYVFVSPILKWTYLFLLIGCVFGTVVGNAATRRFIFLCYYLFAIFAISGCLYLFAPFDWVPTMPVYYENVVAPIWVAGAVAGYSALFSWSGTSLIQFITRVRSFGSCRLSMSMLSPAIGALFIPMVLAWFNYLVVPGNSSFSPRLVNYLNEPWADNTVLLQYLDERIGLSRDKKFRGSAQLNPYFDYPSSLTLSSMWLRLIPTLNANSTFESPIFNYLRVQEGLMRGQGSQHDALRQAAGVRFWLQAREEGNATFDSSRFTPGDDLKLRLAPPMTPIANTVRTYDIYEYAHPNWGNYSPTEVVYAKTAATTLQQLLDVSFEPRKTVVVNEPLESLLVPATAGEMLVGRGQVQIKARSVGTSVILLPLQYSRCLTVQSAQPARLFRADLLQTGILFEGELSAILSFRFGLITPTCRKEDLADLSRLEIASPLDDPGLWRFRHPHALSSLAEIPSALHNLVIHVARVP